MIKIINEVNFDKWEEENNFGEEWIVNIPKECIKDVTLLSIEECEEHKDNIPEVNKWWWLRSPGRNSSHAADVNRDGSVYYDGNHVLAEDDYIRPALILNLRAPILNFEVGDKIKFGEHLFTILSNNLAICDDFIGKGCFRKDWKAEDANVYEKSDVKKYVDDWFNKAYNEYEVNNYD